MDQLKGDAATLSPAAAEGEKRGRQRERERENDACADAKKVRSKGAATEIIPTPATAV